MSRPVATRLAGPDEGVRHSRQTTTWIVVVAVVGALSAAGLVALQIIAWL